MTKKRTKFQNESIVDEYVESIFSGRKRACKSLKLAIIRYKADRENDLYEFNPADAEFVIQIIEKKFAHMKGETLEGVPLRGKPFLLEPFHKFIVYNLLGFFHKGTKRRRFHEAFIFIPRKNIKTSFAAALALSLIHISEPTRQAEISYAVFCLKKKKIKIIKRKREKKMKYII